MPKQQTDASQINHFQDDTQQRLRTILAEKRQSGRFEIVELPPEPFGTLKTNELAVKATAGNYEIWIYPDGANVIGGQIDKRFEIYDYGSLNDLQSALLKFVGELSPLT
jgi:hypothetical protein